MEFDSPESINLFKRVDAANYRYLAAQIIQKHARAMIARKRVKHLRGVSVDVINIVMKEMWQEIDEREKAATWVQKRVMGRNVRKSVVVREKYEEKLQKMKPNIMLTQAYF